MSKMKFGEWVGAVIAGNSGCSVMKIGNDYYNMEAIVAAAKEIDQVLLLAQLEERKLSRFENLMMEILFCQAGWKSVTEANESYRRYLARSD